VRWMMQSLYIQSSVGVNNMSMVDKETADAAGGLVAAVVFAAGATTLSPIVGVLVPLALRLADRLCDAGYEVLDVETLRAKAQAMADLSDLETEE